MVALKKDKVPKTAPEGTLHYFRGENGAKVYVRTAINPNFDHVQPVGIPGAKSVVVSCGLIDSAHEVREALSL